MHITVNHHEDLPAADAASFGDFTSADLGLKGEALLRGLLLRWPLPLFPAGERDRRSNRDARFGSGSV